jgi:hypothetical protein
VVGFESYDVNIQQVFTNTLPSSAFFLFLFYILVVKLLNSCLNFLLSI